jgi:hypothetical protein
MYDFYSTKAFEDAYTYSGNDLGAIWDKEHTKFRVWAPTAKEVNIKLYKSGMAGQPAVSCFVRVAFIFFRCYDYLNNCQNSGKLIWSIQLRKLNMERL